MTTYVADFETTCSEYDIALSQTRVWLFDLCEIHSLEHISGRSMDEFIEVIKRLSPCQIYFHNLKFDGSFIISWLLFNGFKHMENNSNRKQPLKAKEFSTLITELGAFYSIVVKFDDESEEIEFRDSFKKIQGKVEDIAKAYDLPIRKGECDYTKFRDVDYEPTEEELSYVRRDTEIVARIIAIQYSEKMTYMTSASDTMHLYQQSLATPFRKLFPILKSDVDDFIRNAYRGGVCQVNPKYVGREVDLDNVYDVNSMYPFQMCTKPLPFGYPEFFEGKYEEDYDYPLYIQRVRICFELKEGYLPTILENRLLFCSFSSYDSYVRSTHGAMQEFTFSSLDLELVFRHYYVYQIEYLDGYKFQASTNLFKKYIEPLYEEKCRTKGAKKQLNKILINSLYGKFASQTKRYNQVPILCDNGMVRYEVSDKATTIASIYTATSVFVCSYAHMQLFNAIDDNMDIFIYCDTDSIHLNGFARKGSIEVDSKKLGAWKLESSENPIKKARYLGAKCYIQVLALKTEENPRALNIKVAGASPEVKEHITFENFKEGLTIPSCKMIPRRVKGGVILEPVDFTIKARNGEEDSTLFDNSLDD